MVVIVIFFSLSNLLFCTMKFLSNLYWSCNLICILWLWLKLLWSFSFSLSIFAQSGVVVLGLESDLLISGVVGQPIYKPDRQPKHVGFRFENSSVGSGLKIHLNQFCCGSGFCSTRPEPDSLSSLLVRCVFNPHCSPPFLFKPMVAERDLNKLQAVLVQTLLHLKSLMSSKKGL
jgi:hypothetical protein